MPAHFIAKLAAAGVRISLGHSMATYAQTQAAMPQGLPALRICSTPCGRWRAASPADCGGVESPQACYGLIVDGVHVAPAMLRLALRGAGHPILVTDAMPPVGGTRSSFALAGETIVVRDGRCIVNATAPWPGLLDMAGAVRNCVRLLGVPLTDALRFASPQSRGVSRPR